VGGVGRVASTARSSVSSAHVTHLLLDPATEEEMLLLHLLGTPRALIEA
jgi:hypothetical protein